MPAKAAKKPRSKAVTALVKRKPRPPKFDPLAKPTPQDERRWTLAMTGRGAEEIAIAEGVAPETVERSLILMRAYRYRNSNDVVQLRLNETVLAQMPAVGRTLTAGLKAKKIIPLGMGKSKTVPDHAIQLKTVETIKGLHELAQPKVPLVQNNTQLNFPGQGQSGGQVAAGLSFESRVRMLRERRGLTNGENEREYDEGELMEGEQDETEDFIEDMAASGVERVDADPA